MKRRDPITRYLYVMQRAATAWTARAEREAQQFAQTGEHQQIHQLFDVRDDERRTALLLARYEGWLRLAQREGRYTGSTVLKRMLADGSSEPWSAWNQPTAAGGGTPGHPFGGGSAPPR